MNLHVWCNSALCLAWSCQCIKVSVYTWLDLLAVNLCNKWLWITADTVITGGIVLTRKRHWLFMCGVVMMLRSLSLNIPEQDVWHFSDDFFCIFMKKCYVFWFKSYILWCHHISSHSRLRFLWLSVFVNNPGDIFRYAASTETTVTHSSWYHLNTLRARQNGFQFPDDSFNRIFVNANVWILFKISLKFVPKSPVNSIPALV